jgi:hypothetical protein
MKLTSQSPKSQATRNGTTQPALTCPKKADNVEGKNHFVNNPPGAVVTPQMVLGQAALYEKPDVLKGICMVPYSHRSATSRRAPRKGNTQAITWRLLHVTL